MFILQCNGCIVHVFLRYLRIHSPFAGVETTPVTDQTPIDQQCYCKTYIMSASRSRMNVTQQETMLDFMDRHNDLAKGRITGADAKKTCKTLWVQLCAQLNADAGGATKDWKGWTKTWSDWKFHVKKKMSMNANAARQTGGGPPLYKPLSAMEQRVAVYVGRERVEGDMDDNAETMPEVDIEIQYINMAMELDEHDLLAAVAGPSGTVETPPAVPGPSQTVPPGVVATPTRAAREKVADVQQNLVNQSLESLQIQPEMLQLKKDKDEREKEKMVILKRKEERDRQFQENSLELQRDSLGLQREVLTKINIISEQLRNVELAKKKE